MKNMRESILLVTVLSLPVLWLLPAFAADWPMWGGTPERNMISEEKGIPRTWNVEDKTNIKWVAELGSQSYGNPVVAGGKVFVGTNNELMRNPKLGGDRGVLMAFRESDGEFLWQMTHEKLAAGRVNDWPEQGVCSSPAVADNIVYYVSNRAEVMALDVEGFRDGENDGPFKDEEHTSEIDGDIIWTLNMYDDLAVFPHNMAATSPLIVGDILYVNTSNGVDESHVNIPFPEAPSFLAINRHTGEVLWENGDPGDQILHGQWASPAYGEILGVPQVIFAGGDGWLRSFQPKTGKPIWRFDVNPKASEWKQGRGDRNNIIATPVIYDDKVFLCVGQDPEHGEGPGHLYAIDATKRGDITQTGRVWHVGGDDYHRSMSTVAIHDGLLFTADLSGFVYCLDVKTGKPHWKYDTYAAIWGSPYVVDGKVYLGDEEGQVTVLRAAKKLTKLAVNELDDSVYTTPVAANGVLYVANRRMLYAIAPGPASAPVDTKPTETGK